MYDKEFIKKQIIKKIKASNNILVTSHIMPDGDNIGSVCALAKALTNDGYIVDSVLFDDVPVVFKFLPNSEKIKKVNEIINKKYDIIIVLDSSSVERVGFNIYQYSDFIINIDHHACNEQFGNLNFVFSNYSSTSQMVYEIIKKGRFKIDSDIATCLYCGLMTDTVNFQTSGTNDVVFKIASQLVKYGANPNYISRNVFQTKSIKNITIIGKALSSLNFTLNNSICWVKIDQKLLNEHDASITDCLGIIGHMISIKDVEVAILFVETNDKKVLVEFRSKTFIDVNKIANLFGGGGHVRASGATILGDINNVIAEVINSTIEFINNSTYFTQKGTNVIDSSSNYQSKSSQSNFKTTSMDI